MNRVNLSLLTACTVVGLACSGGEVKSAAHTVRDSAGIVVVENRAPLWTENQRWRLSDEPVLRIGAVDGDDAYLFSWITGAVRLADGRIVVANGASRELRFFDPKGTHLMSVGGQGGGPGEFHFLGSIAKASGDTLLAWDTGSGIKSFTPDGEYVELNKFMLTPDLFELPIFSEHGVVMPDGNMLLHLFEAGRGRSGELSLWTQGFVRHVLETGRQDTVGLFRVHESFSVGGEGGWYPFSRDAVEAHSSTHIFTGHTGEYSVAAYSYDGTLERIIRREQDRLPVTQADRDVVRDRVLDRAKGTPREAGYQRWLDQMPWAEVKPAFAGLQADLVGNLWVLETSEADSAEAHWTVFDPEGRMLGTLTTPPLRLFEIGDDYVLALWRDELEVEYILKYDLLKP